MPHLLYRPRSVWGLLAGPAGDAVADVRPAGDAVADAPAAAGGRRRDCVVMMDGMVIAGHVNDVQTLMRPIIGRQ